LKPFLLLLRIFIAAAFVLPLTTYGQDSYKIQGIVKDNRGEPLIGASIDVEGMDLHEVTNEKGQFTLAVPRRKSYVVSARHIGFKPASQTISFASLGKPLTMLLQDDHTQLSEVQVTGRTETQEARLQPIKAEVINTKAVQEQPSTLVELMNRSAGIRIRQTGGLGSNAGLMMNGFQDRAIKNFKDGIPMDYLGAGYNIALVPVNMLERVEVYKGVRSIWLRRNRCTAMPKRRMKLPRSTPTVRRSMGFIRIPPGISSSAPMRLSTAPITTTRSM
jgi:hypothetical protein